MRGPSIGAYLSGLAGHIHRPVRNSKRADGQAPRTGVSTSRPARPRLAAIHGGFRMSFVTRRKSIDALAAARHGRGLKPTLSWHHLIALGVGAIVGTGIYTLTGISAGLAGPGVIFSFAIAGAVCACAALAYAEMATL